MAPILNKFKKVKNQIADKSARSIAKSIWFIQSRFAREMNVYAEKLSTRQKKTSLLIFVVLAVAYSSLLFYQGIYPPTKQRSIFPSKIHSTLPQSIELPDSLNLYLLRQYKSLSDSSKHAIDTIHP